MRCMFVNFNTAECTAAGHFDYLIGVSTCPCFCVGVECRLVNTVVPALGDPVVTSHLAYTATLSMSRHIPKFNYLRSADTYLTRTRTIMYWLSVPVITDSSNNCRVFDGNSNTNFCLVPRVSVHDRYYCSPYRQLF